MKTRTSPIWILGLVLFMAWLPGGLAQNEIRRSSPFSWAATSLSAVTNSRPPTTNVPPKIHLSPWTSEVVKLAQVGIDDNVVLSFIDNSGMFNLGAEQIIYLSDLGVSSDVISEMLRHDAEVIAGVRALTISSDPPRDSSMLDAFAAGSSAARKTIAQPSTTSASSDSASSQAIVPSQQRLPELYQSVTNAESPAFEFAMCQSPGTEVRSQQRQSDGKRGLYRVREPYPVELTAPIVFVKAAERTPNTIVIERFPESADER